MRSVHAMDVPHHSVGATGDGKQKHTACDALSKRKGRVVG